jgi:Protein of unknown function (DUF3455)
MEEQMRIARIAGVVALLPVALTAAAAGESVPDSLAPPAGLKRVLQASAVGVQIYRCGPPKTAGGAAAAVWNFEAPRATLTDERGKTVGRHYAGPIWEATDGSKVSGKVTARADATEAGAIPWLLLKTEPAAAKGRFDHVQAVQRLFTSGGSAPTGACPKVGEVLEVPYRAQYVFWGE